jgi:hypothetical protein
MIDKVYIFLLAAGVAIATFFAIRRFDKDDRKRGDVQISMYSTGNGNWVLEWIVPSTGTPPITYDYSISDVTPGITPRVVQSGTGLTMTSVVLDPTNFTPDGTVTDGYMSHNQYTATITAKNAAGAGPSGELDFSIYDTPNLVKLVNNNNNQTIYPGSGGNIFYSTGTNQYTVSLLQVYLADYTPKAGIVGTVTINGTPYTSSVVTIGNAPSAQWGIRWANLPPIGPSTSVNLEIKATNSAGTSDWKQTFTTPTPAPIPPSAPLTASVVMVGN